MDLRPNGTAHDFGVIWNGYIRCDAAGDYQFKARYDDGFRLLVSDDNNQMKSVIDGWATGPFIAEGSITLQGQKWYKLQAQYFNDEDRSYIQLYWIPPRATQWAVVPTNMLRTQ
jgi:hypothetical protein